MFVRHFQHTQVHARVFVAGKSHVTNFAFLLCFGHCFVRPAVRKKTIGIFQPNILMKLPEIHMIDLQALQRLIELLQCGLFGAAVELRHDENFFAIALQGFADAPLTLALVVIPRVV